MSWDALIHLRLLPLTSGYIFKDTLLARQRLHCSPLLLQESSPRLCRRTCWKSLGRPLRTPADLGPAQRDPMTAGRRTLIMVSRVALQPQRLAMDFPQNGISLAQWPPLSPSWRLTMMNCSSGPSVSKMQIFSPSAATKSRNANFFDSWISTSPLACGTNRPHSCADVTEHCSALGRARQTTWSSAKMRSFTNLRELHQTYH